MNSEVTSAEDSKYLLTAGAVRERCLGIFHRAQSNDLQAFTYHPESLDSLVAFVERVTRENYPELDIPYHSRWRHFEVADGALLKKIGELFQGLDKEERVRAQFDLVIASVLLDAGAGAKWSYYDADSNLRFSRSEGLAVASVDLVMSGVLSDREDAPYRVDADALLNFTPEQLAHAFQVTEDNPLTGLEGRCSLLRSLGQAIVDAPEIFGSDARLGNIADFILAKREGDTLAASDLLSSVLQALGSIWPGRLTLQGVALGDVWEYPPTGKYIPFHKLSQWLVYSLCEPLEEYGLKIIDIDQLTSLAEYRNGGLLIDSGVLLPRETAVLEQPFDPGAVEIIEWRAMTISVLDVLAKMLRERLGLSEEDFPLAKMLEGGTWAAGRQLANSLREGGVPPIRLASDGTVF